MILMPLLLQAAAILPPDVAALPTARLAARIMGTPPEPIVAHRLRSDPHLGRVDAIDFYPAAERYGPGLCRRRVYTVAYGDLSRAAAPGGAPAVPLRREQLALAADCTALPVDRGGQVQPAAALGDAATALRWLADRRRRGGAAGVTCLPAEIRPDPCAGGAAAVLAALPLDHDYLIDRGAAPGEWRFAMSPRPGQLFYDVRLARDARGTPVMTIRWSVPAPF